MKTILAFLLIPIALLILLVVGIPAFIANIYHQINKLEEYFTSIAHGIDVLGAGLLYNKRRRTISAISYDRGNKGNLESLLFYKLIDILAYVLSGQKNHCKEAYEYEESLFVLKDKEN